MKPLVALNDRIAVTGIDAGDAVVLSGTTKLTDGSQVRATNGNGQ